MNAYAHARSLLTSAEAADYERGIADRNQAMYAAVAARRRPLVEYERQRQEARTGLDMGPA